MSCGVPSCHYKAKQYGVCGVHKKKAYLCDDTSFQNDMNNYRQLMRRFVEEDARLESQGIDLLQIQTYWSDGVHMPNLARPRQRPLPEHFKVAGDIMEKMRPMIREMQKKYDPYLVYNVCVRINHSSTPNCPCSYCQLGKKIV